MEGLGAAASVIAVIQITTKVVSLSYGYIAGVKRAPGNLQTLVDELKSLTGILTGFQIHAQDPRSIVLQQLDVPLQKYKLEMMKLHDKLELKQRKSGWWGAALVRLQWPFGEAETLGFILEIERFKTSLILAMNIDQRPRSQAIETSIQEINESRRMEDIEIIDKKCMDALNRISPETFNERHIEISNRRKERTGQWILRLPEVQDWRKNPGLLWGYGIPGAGKTFLSSLVVDNLQAQATTAGYGVAYIYFNYKEQEKQRPVHVLASLVKQLACQTRHLPKELDNLVQERRPTIKELYVALLGVVRLFTQVFFVFDALDECDQTTQRKELLPLFHQMGGDGMHLFLTSREHPEDIQHSFQNTAKVKLWAKDEDIASYVEQKISENPRAERLVGQGSYKDRIISELIDCAKGMFLLVHFHIEYLCQQTTIRQILEELEKLKSTSANTRGPLGPTYDRAMDILHAQPPNCTELAIRILSWLVKARRILTVRELQLAVSAEQHRTTFDELDLPHLKTMLDVCASLVTFDKNSNTIRLAHYTVQEYLLQNPTILEHANFKVAMSCMSFLSSELFAMGACNSENSLKYRLELYPFLLYASRHTPFHLSVCEENLSKELVLGFVGSPGSIASYLQAVYFNMDNVSNYPYYKLYDRYSKGWTPLHIACTLGHRSIVQLLLENGADISATNDSGHTALHIAALSGKLIPESSKIVPIIRLLFEKGADISTVDEYGNTALHLAIQVRGKEVAHLLLEESADVSATDNGGMTALHHAAAYGLEDLVALLLEKGADISATNNYEEAALHLAAGYRGNVIALLLEKGADISATDGNEMTALHHAAREGEEDSVALLLEKGADISATDSNGMTALHHAAKDGEDSVALLLEKGADISATDNYGMTALHHAAEDGWENSIALLLEKGADISTIDSNGMTALHHAATSWRGEDFVAFLLEKGADISATDSNGMTALHHAARDGGKDLVALLLEKGADISATDSNKMTALHHVATNWQRENSVALLLEKGADISATDNNGMTALEWAIKKNKGKVIQLLRDKSVELPAGCLWARTTL